MTILFDLDGTLTDPFEGITRCHQHALERMGVLPIPTQRELARYIGPPLRRSYATLLDASATPEDIERAVVFFRERFSTIGIFENLVYPGVEAMLAELVARGHRLFVATSKPREYAARILGHFGLSASFTAVYGAEPDGRLDDKADLLAHLLEERRLDRTATVMVGDREHDVFAAKRNGLRAIGVTWGYGSSEELIAAGADRLCASPAELVATLGDMEARRCDPARPG
jgi:phosphoglycolate phosphatase